MVTATPIFPQVVENYVAQILPAQSTNLVTLATGGTNGTKIEALMITSTDTAAHVLQLWVTISSVNYLLGSITIPITAGDIATTPTVSILNNSNMPGLPVDSNGNSYIYLASGSVLSISTTVAVTTAKAIQAFAQGGNY